MKNEFLIKEEEDTNSENIKILMQPPAPADVIGINKFIQALTSTNFLIELLPDSTKEQKQFVSQFDNNVITFHLYPKNEYYTENSQNPKEFIVQPIDFDELFDVIDSTVQSVASTVVNDVLIAIHTNTTNNQKILLNYVDLTVANQILHNELPLNQDIPEYDDDVLDIHPLVTKAIQKYAIQDKKIKSINAFSEFSESEKVKLNVIIEWTNSYEKTKAIDLQKMFRAIVNANDKEDSTHFSQVHITDLSEKFTKLAQDLYFEQTLIYKEIII